MLNNNETFLDTLENLAALLLVVTIGAAFVILLVVFFTPVAHLSEEDQVTSERLAADYATKVDGRIIGCRHNLRESWCDMATTGTGRTDIYRLRCDPKSHYCEARSAR